MNNTRNQILASTSVAADLNDDVKGRIDVGLPVTRMLHWSAAVLTTVGDMKLLRKRLFSLSDSITFYTMSTKTMITYERNNHLLIPSSWLVRVAACQTNNVIRFMRLETFGWKDEFKLVKPKKNLRLRLTSKRERTRFTDYRMHQQTGHI